MTAGEVVTRLVPFAPGAVTVLLAAVIWSVHSVRSGLARRRRNGSTTD